MKYEIMDKYIGEKLAEARAHKGESLATTGEHVGLNRQTFYNYEKGARTMPIDVYVRVCRYFGIDAEELFKEAQDYMREHTF